MGRGRGTEPSAELVKRLESVSHGGHHIFQSFSSSSSSSAVFRLFFGWLIPANLSPIAFSIQPSCILATAAGGTTEDDDDDDDEKDWKCPCPPCETLLDRFNQLR
jgi:hypothetical protein